MKLVWIIIILTTLGYLGGRFVFSKEKLPALIRDIFLTGWEFILIGALIGPGGFQIIEADRLEWLDPFVALGLGWAGLIFGAQMSRKDLMKVEPAVIRLTASQVSITFAGIFVFVFFFSLIFFDVSVEQIITIASVVSAASAISSPTALAIMAPALPKSRLGAIRTLRLIATLDVAPAIALVGIVFCFFSAEAGSEFSWHRGLAFLPISFLLALGLAFFFRYFDRDRLNEEENMTVLLGFIVLIAGMALYLSLSPLFLSFLVGVILANLLNPDDRIFTMLFATEKPFYVILLLVTGLWMSLFSAVIIAGALIVAVLRLWLKVYVLERRGGMFYEDHKTTGRNAGLALVAQGALAPAIGLNYLLTYPGEGPKIAFTIIVIGMVVNEITAPFLIRRALGGTTE